MAFEFAWFAAMAVVLGFKHAFDADHVVAIGNRLTRQTHLERTVGLSATWALGHMLTAGAISALVYVFADTLLPQITGRLELLVPIMLIAIGAFGLFAEWRRVHIHSHEHEGRRHTHVHAHGKSNRHDHGAMAGIGIVHGLASNDELLIVLVIGLAADAWWQVGIGVALFSLGVLAGMLLFAAAIHLTQARGAPAWVPSVATVTFSLLSIAYAVYLLAGGAGFNLVEQWMPTA